MKLELTEEEVDVLREGVDSLYLRAVDNLDKAIGYQFHDEMAKARKQIKVYKSLSKRLEK